MRAENAAVTYMPLAHLSPAQPRLHQLVVALRHWKSFASAAKPSPREDLSRCRPHATRAKSCHTLMASFTQKTNPYKHLSGRETTLLTHLQPATPSIAASDAFYAVPYKSGGGGPVYIGRLDQTSKVEPAEALSHCIQGHKAEVKAVAFSPFHSALLATGGEDCRVRIAANVEDPSKESLEVGAHGSGVRCLAFHPAAEHVLLSAASDGSWATWDVASELNRAASIHTGKLDAAITHVDWNRSTFAASCRDRTLRCVDVRTGAVAWSSMPHGGARAFRAVFASRIEHCVLSVGSASSGGREVSLIDVRKPDAVVVSRVDIDFRAPHVVDAMLSP